MKKHLVSVSASTPCYLYLTDVHEVNKEVRRS